MTKEALASWLMEHSSVPQTVLKPIATRLGVPMNHLGAALFAGQLVYENQDVIVTYASKGGVTVGEFLHARSRQRYGEDHPLTQHLDENVEAITEAFEGTEEEARTFAEFYRQYRSLDREHRLRDEIGRRVPESISEAVPEREAMPGADAVPGRELMPDRDALPGSDALPGRGAIPGASAIPSTNAISHLRKSNPDEEDADDAVEIPVTETE